MERNGGNADNGTYFSNHDAEDGIGMPTLAVKLLNALVILQTATLIFSGKQCGDLSGPEAN